MGLARSNEKKKAKGKNWNNYQVDVDDQIVLIVVTLSFFVFLIAAAVVGFAVLLIILGAGKIGWFAGTSLGSFLFGAGLSSWSRPFNIHIQLSYVTDATVATHSQRLSTPFPIRRWAVS